MSDIYRQYYYMYLSQWMCGHDVPEYWREKFEERYDDGFYQDRGGSRMDTGRSEDRRVA